MHVLSTTCDWGQCVSAQEDTQGNMGVPDLITGNQIDHVCIAKKFRRSLEDVRVKKGADVTSDHHLVVNKLKL